MNDKLKDIIIFLESKESCWSLTKNRGFDYTKIANKHDITLNRNDSRCFVKRALKEKIISCLKGDQILDSEYSKIEDHFCFKYFSSLTETSFENIFSIIFYLRHIVNRLESYTNSESSWSDAKDLLNDYLLISTEKPDLSLANITFEEKVVVSNSVKYLTLKKYKIEIISGQIKLDNDSENLIINKIDQRLKILGRYAIEAILSNLSKYFNSANSRFYLRSEPSCTEKN